MADKKKLNEELEKVSGGKQDNFGEIYCTKCCKSFYATETKSRSAGSGCSKHIEYQCPDCQSWMQE